MKSRTGNGGVLECCGCRRGVSVWLDREKGGVVGGGMKVVEIVKVVKVV